MQFQQQDDGMYDCEADDPDFWSTLTSSLSTPHPARFDSLMACLLPATILMCVCVGCLQEPVVQSGAVE
jgi:hypothetical protein